MTDPRAEIFAAVRNAKPGVFGDPNNIMALDDLLDRFGIGRTGEHREINGSGLALIKRSEGLELKAYPDPGSGGDPWTIGYGHTGPDVRPGMVITEAQAEELLKKDLERFEAAVADMCKVATDNQFSAMVSLAFNVGEENFRRSTLRRMHNEGDHMGAANEFQRWNRASGRVLNGLVRRRAAEAQLYRSA